MLCRRKFSIDSSGYPSPTYAAFKNMRENAMLCDVTVKCGDVSIPAHRAVLATTIPYFHLMFTSNFAEKTKNTVEVHEVDPSTLVALIDLAYTRELKITQQNAESLLEASSYLLITDVKTVCCQYITDHLDSFNVINIWKLAYALDCLDLKEACHQYMCKNFHIISQKDEFSELPFICVKKLVGMEYLSVLSEVQVFESIIKWVKFLPDERHHLLPELLRNVQMLFIPQEYFTAHVITEDLINSSPLCKDLVKKAQQNVNGPESSLLIQNILCRRRYRNPDIHGIYVFCHQEDTGYAVHFFDMANNRWMKLVTENRTNSSGSGYGTFCDGEKFYLTGDFLTWTLDLHTLRWDLTVIVDSDKAQWHAVAVINSAIFYLNNSNSQFMRRYCLLKKEWLKQIQLKRKISYPGVVCLKNSMFIIGGKSNDEICDIVEEYNLMTGKSTRRTPVLARKRSPMLTKRLAFGCTTLNGKIYVGGGFDHCKQVLNSVEVYDPAENAWDFIKPMSFPRESFSLVGYDGKLYAFNKCTEENGFFFHSYEVYHPNEDAWKKGTSIVCYHDAISEVKAATA